MRTRSTSTTALLARLALAFVLVMATIGAISHARLAIAQEDAALDPIMRIATLVPADATALVAIGTDTESAQWDIAADLLERAGLEDFVFGLINQFLREGELSPSNLDPEQSSILGGSAALATWGDPADPIDHAAVYIAATNPEAAYRSVQAQLLAETGVEVTEVDIPGGRATTSTDSSLVIMLLDDVVVLAESTDAERVTGLTTGAGPTLVTFEQFTTVMEAQSADTIARAYINGPSLGQNSAELLMSAFDVSFSELAVLLGLVGPITTNHSSLGLEAAEDGFHLRMAQLPAPLVGQMWPTDGPRSDPAERLSDQTDLMVAGTDLGAHPLVVQLVNSIVFGAATSISPFDPASPTAMEDAYEGLNAATGIDIQAEILDQLTGDYVLAVSPNSLDRVTDVDAVLVSEVADVESVRDTLNQIVGALRLVIAARDVDAELSEVSVDEDTLYRLTASDVDQGVDLDLTFGLVGDELVLSAGDGFERLLNPADGATLATDPRYQQVRGSLADQDGPGAFIDVHNLIDIQGLVALEPPDTSALPDGSALASLDGIQALGAVTYKDRDLAITEIVLTISETTSDSPGTPEAPPPAPEATPQVR